MSDLEIQMHCLITKTTIPHRLQDNLVARPSPKGLSTWTDKGHHLSVSTPGKCLVVKNQVDDVENTSDESNHTRSTTSMLHSMFTVQYIIC